MFNLKKAMVAGATFVLAAGIIAPFGASSVADAETATGFEYVKSVAADTISLVSTLLQMQVSTHWYSTGRAALGLQL